MSNVRQLMLSLLILDSPSWWTTLGSLIKYLSIIGACVCGVAIFRRSRAAYFGLGWMVVIAAPLIILSAVKDAAGAAFLFVRPSHEDIFIFVWLFLGLLELFIIWVPIAGMMVGRGNEESESGDGSAA